MFAPKYRLLHFRQSFGFTLIELLIVIVIAGVLAMIAIPSFQSFVAQQKIKTTSFDIISSLTLARSEALKRNTNVGMTPADGNNWQSGWTVAVGVTTLSQHDAVAGLTVSCKSGTTAVAPCPAITYNSNGRISGAASPSIQISSAATDSSSTRCISVDLGGRPNSKKTSCP